MDARLARTSQAGAETFLRPSQHPPEPPRSPPWASTSALTVENEDGRDGAAGDGQCWCGATSTGRSARRRMGKRARRSSTGSTALAAAAAAALALLPCTTASPVQLGKRVALPTPIVRADLLLASPPTPDPNPTPTTAPVVQRRATLPLFEPTTAWTLNGKTGAGRLAAYPTNAPAGTVMQDNFDVAASSAVSASSISFTRASASTPSASSASASSSVSSKFVVPAGWAAKSRKTDYYAVPIIISTSVILAVIVIGAIVGSVVWRRKARIDGRKAERRDPEKALAAKGVVGRALAKVRKGKGKAKGSADGGSDAGRASPVVASGRLRQRRPRRARPARVDAPDDENTALTRSVSSGSHAPPDTLTHRLATRLRLKSSAPASEASPTVVFSNGSPLTRSRSTLGLTLSRTSSHQSSLGQPADRPSSLRAPPPAPASPSLSSPSSTFGGLFALDGSLPAPGPPAYRPSSSTIGTTTRLTSSILPSRRVPPPVDDELRWPEEKVRPPSRSPTPVASTSAPPPPPPPVDEPEPDEHPPEPFAAHLATDDKALLALIAQQASSSASSSAERLQGTAPDADVDPDGFERFEPETETPPDSTSTMLPLPPAAVRTAFDFSSGTQDVLPLPVYVPRTDAPEPSAPPPDEDDEDGYDAEERYDEGRFDEERWQVRPASMEGREEHREV